MSETTKRALNADLIDLSIPWHKRVDRTHLIAAPVANTPPRPSRLTAEGGAKLETTNSPAKNRAACTGRKSALSWVESRPLSLCLLVIVSVAACLILSHGSDLSVVYGPAFVAFCVSIVVLWKTAPARMALCAFVIGLILMDILVIGGAWSVLDAVGLVVWVNMLRREFASDGKGV